MTPALVARFAAIEELQRALRKHLPGSRRYNEIEHAIDLALSQRRVVNCYLVRNLLRDSKRILDRQWQARQYVDVDDPDGALPESLIDRCTAEDFLAAEQLVQSVVRSARHASRHADLLLLSIIEGASLRDTAALIGCSTSRVNQLWHAIRAIAAKEAGNHG